MNIYDNPKELIERVNRIIPMIVKYHSPDNELYFLFDDMIKGYFSHFEKEVIDVEPFDGLVWPHISIGNMTSYDLFHLQQSIRYIYYLLNRDKYKIAFDIGSHIGLESIILEKFGYEV